MSEHYIPPLRRRFLEDMRIKGLQPKTQTMYLRAMRDFTRFVLPNRLLQQPARIPLGL